MDNIPAPTRSPCKLSTVTVAVTVTGAPSVSPQCQTVVSREPSPGRELSPRHHIAEQLARCIAALAIVAGTSLALTARAAPPADAPAEKARVLTTEEILRAMRGARGFDTTVTTNAVRFQTTTILNLIRWAKKADKKPRPLLLGHREWFQAFLKLNGLKAKDAPVFSRLAFEYGQEMLVDYRLDRVFRNATTSRPLPKLAANIKLWWPKDGTTETSYSFLDELSVPKLKVTNQRLIKYRLLEFPDMIVCDKIEGLRGRPVSGLLGLLFKVIGEGRVVRSRFSIADDGSQVVWAQVVKGMLGRKATATVDTDGRAVKGIPAKRPDLKAMESKLKKMKSRFDYEPF